MFNQGMDTVAIHKGSTTFNFCFDWDTDDPAEGATLTSIIVKGERVAPSKYKGDIPYQMAAIKLGIRSM